MENLDPLDRLEVLEIVKRKAVAQAFRLARQHVSDQVFGKTPPCTRPECGWCFLIKRSSRWN
jgi:hypothetical protein